MNQTKTQKDILSLYSEVTTIKIRKAVVVSLILCFAVISQSCNAYRRIFDVSNKYVAGAKNGLWTEVDTLGMISIVNYKQGIKTNEYLRIDPYCLNCKTNNSKATYNRLLNNKKNGIWIEATWDVKPYIIEICEYKNGERHGLYIKINYPDNSMRVKGKYRRNRMNGWFYYYMDNGSLMGKCKYSNGKITQRCMVNPRYF